MIERTLWCLSPSDAFKTPEENLSKMAASMPLYIMLLHFLMEKLSEPPGELQGFSEYSSIQLMVTAKMR